MAAAQGTLHSSHTHHASLSELSNMSVMLVRATSLDLCEFVYGENPSSMELINCFYESNAIYENPFLTATSRSVIADIHRLSRQLSSIDIPRPLAMLCTLFRIKIPESSRNNNVLFRGVRVWTEMGDICENESFDGHMKTIVEHTLNILLLPGIHCEASRPQGSTDSLVSVSGSPSSVQPYPASPSLHVPGTSLSVPSPLHFQLHVVTRLSFNEQGRVTHHRDFWDVKDVIGLVPGVSLAQWIGTRLAAFGISYFARFWTREKAQTLEQAVMAEAGDLDKTAADACSTLSVKNALGLDGVYLRPAS